MVQEWWAHRFAQPLGKQYSYGKGPNEESELAQLRKKVAYYEIREELLGKYPSCLFTSD
jgi:transposase